MDALKRSLNLAPSPEPTKAFQAVHTAVVEALAHMPMCWFDTYTQGCEDAGLRDAQAAGSSHVSGG
jgi:hypothetical protein